MVIHQTIVIEAEPEPIAVACQELKKAAAIHVIVEDGFAGVAPVENMVARCCGPHVGPGTARHN